MKTITFNDKTVALLLFLFVTIALASAVSFATQQYTTIHTSGVSGSAFELLHSSGALSGGALGGASK